MSTEIKMLKVSICQKCNGWVRAAALDYFNTDRKARNEFMREVAQHNLSVREIPLTEWQENKIEYCTCK